MDEIIKDERFKHILNDPRFRKMPKNIQKVTIDKRFKGMFKDKKFKGKCMFDKRGRPLNLTSSENLRKLYEVSSESSASEDEEEGTKNQKNLEKKSGKGFQLAEKIKHEKQTSSKTLSFKKVSKLTTKSLTKIEQNIESSKNSDFGYKHKNDDKKSKNPKDSFCDNLEDNNTELKGSCKTLRVKSQTNILPEKTENTLKKVQNKKNINIKQNLSMKQNSFVEEDSSIEKLLDVNKTDQCPESENKKIEHASKTCTEYENSPLNQTQKDTYLLESGEEEESSSNDVDNSNSSEESDDSDDSESDSKNGDASKEFDHQWEELRNEAPDTDEITHRFAVCNMDWDRIRAEDLFACFNSFKPADGYINSVKIYPSDYGLKRMEEEKMTGPPELVEETLPSDAEEEPEDKKQAKYHREKLRQYQINRLKYFYAVIDCDSAETANTLYEQLNGMEYESSSIRFDLRFIPDDITFDQDPISSADKPPNPSEYKPRLFVTSALQQVKVNLTWDETDPKRRETLQKAFTEPDDIEKDIRDYLASSSSESEDVGLNSEEDAIEKSNAKGKIAKYKELLLSLEEKEKNDDNKYEMEITWEPGLKEKAEEIVKEKLNKTNLNPFEEMVQRNKEERKLRRKEQKMTQKQNDENWESADSDDDFFTKDSAAIEKKQNSKQLAELALISDSKKEANSEEKIGKHSRKYKLKKGKLNIPDRTFKMDVNDSRFSAIYSSPLYNIDPSDPHYKDTEGNRALIEEKQKKLKSADFSRMSQIAKRARYS